MGESIKRGIEFMSLHYEELTPEQVALQAALDRSWAGAQPRTSTRIPDFRAHLERSIERANNSNAKPISKEEFLALTEIQPE